MGERLDLIEDAISDRMSLKRVRMHNALVAGFNFDANAEAIGVGALGVVRGLVRAVQSISDRMNPVLPPAQTIGETERAAYEEYTSFQYDTDPNQHL